LNNDFNAKQIQKNYAKLKLKEANVEMHLALQSIGAQNVESALKN
jgi:hypothetical protein